MGKLSNDERYIPSDLIPMKSKGKILADSALSSSAKNKGPNLDVLATQEKQKGGVDNEEEEGGNVSDIPQDEEEEEIADYTIDYYASSEESDGDNGEATF